MSKQAGDGLVYMITGAVTSGTIGFMLLQAIGFLIAGILGAIGGWFANKYIIPHLNNYFKKK